ncbi:glutathione transferase GstA [Microvirga makkahensis]|uniref:Glutathione transferase GstA n=1 Tax=Microvirga makkahensis TaxID=1128670 RepID=A0A7X3MW76_9HYPH|nr:glutathione transferase GstA [Microvirga makkahensis]MXQ14369.1 glutathione transferase GstA [Microvirga makkahensis]
MKLYYAPGACSLAPHIVAREAGLSLDLIKVDLRDRTTETGQSFEEINPKGYVPALRVESGEVLTEVSAIIQYLASQAPLSNLMPGHDGFDRFRFLEWLGFISTEIHKGFGPLWRPNFPEDVKQAARDRLFQRFAYLDKYFAEKPYIMGESFTIADAYLFTVLNWAHVHKLDMSAYSNIAAFVNRIAARPKVQEALATEGLLQKAA